MYRLILFLFVVKVMGQYENVPFNEHEGCTPCCPDSTCQNKQTKQCDYEDCPIECIPVYRCDEGFLRDEISQMCVLPRDCPNYNVKTLTEGDI